MNGLRMPTTRTRWLTYLLAGTAASVPGTASANDPFGGIGKDATLGLAITVGICVLMLALFAVMRGSLARTLALGLLLISFVVSAGISALSLWVFYDYFRGWLLAALYSLLAMQAAVACGTLLLFFRRPIRRAEETQQASAADSSGHGDPRNG